MTDGGDPDMKKRGFLAVVLVASTLLPAGCGKRGGAATRRLPTARILWPCATPYTKARRAEAGRTWSCQRAARKAAAAGSGSD